MKISKNGLGLIKQFEGFIPKVYDDAVGKPTIGYGHLIKDGEQFTTLNEEQAAALLGKDVIIAERAVTWLVTVQLTQGQFDALVSFVYNLGSKSLQNSTLLKRLNAGDYKAAADNFQLWVRAGGRTLPGLVRRRAAEWAMFTGEANG